MNEDIILGGMAILFGGMAVLVPVLGLTLRFAIKPMIETWAEVQRGRVSPDRYALLERQISVLEAELQQVQHAVGAIAEAQEFQRKLADPASSVDDSGLRSLGRG